MARPRSDSPPLSPLPPITIPDFSLEGEAIGTGQVPVAGIDEAGRGPLAGPVVAAAVILDPERIPEGIDDSKRLSALEREALFTIIMASARSVSIASMSARLIDERNILQATLEAMRRAAAGLCTRPALCLIDGRDVPSGLGFKGVPIIKGDQRSLSIAAASIVAKVARDRMMTRCASVHPLHGFGEHMGYGTPRHRAAIVSAGPIARLHRMSFGILRDPELEFE